MIISIGIILTTDKILKMAIVAASIRFPSALFGMFYIFSILVILDSTILAAATGLMDFFATSLIFHSKVFVVVLYSFFGCT